VGLLVLDFVSERSAFSIDRFAGELTTVSVTSCSLNTAYFKHFVGCNAIFIAVWGKYD
jgi:hypothetical protein